MVGGSNVQRSIGGVSEGSTTTIDTDSDTANEVAQTDSYTGPEEGEPGVVCVS